MSALLLGAAVVLGLIGGAANTRPAYTGATGEWPDDAGLADLDLLMDQAGLPYDWKVFLAATAWGESRWHSDVGLGPNHHPGRPPWLRPSGAPESAAIAEADAACRAYDKNAARFQGSPYSRQRYCFGSGGWFGMLPAYAILSGFHATPEYIPEIDPWAVADPLVSLVMAIGYARGLRKWRAFAEGGSTWQALRIGWAAPSKMANAAGPNKMRPKFAEALETIGIGAAYMDQQVTPLTIPKAANLLWLLEDSQGLAAA